MGSVERTTRRRTSHMMKICTCMTSIGNVL